MTEDERGWLWMGVGIAIIALALSWIAIIGGSCERDKLRADIDRIQMQQTIEAGIEDGP